MVTSVSIAGIVGLLLGSFMSVLVMRWPHWRGAAAGRSQCPHCHTALRWYDLVPLVSWVLLRGKCRSCGHRIGLFYPALEAATAIAFMGLAIRVPDYSIPSILIFGAGFCLVGLMFFDARHWILPDSFIIALALTGLLRAWLEFPGSFTSFLITGIALAAFWGGLFLISRGRWVGLGDVKLAFAMGVLFGYPSAVSVMYLAIGGGALLGAILIATHRATRKTALPFGSFWAAAALIALIFPQSIAWLSRTLTLATWF